MELLVKVAWYIPYVRCSWDGASARSYGGIILWVLGWVYGMGFIGCDFVKGVQLGCCDVIMIGKSFGVSSGQNNGVLWEIL